MQKGYYILSENTGDNFHPEFQPELTPKQMLDLGVFGGKYLTDCRQEFPEDWFTHARLSPEKKDISLNHFAVDASLPLRVWRERGWIHFEVGGHRSEGIARISLSSSSELLNQKLSKI